jgi:hypothetical protein
MYISIISFITEISDRESVKSRNWLCDYMFSYFTEIGESDSEVGGMLLQITGRLQQQIYGRSGDI